MTRVVSRDFGPRRYRCGVCHDIGWLETNPEGRGTVKPCSGPKGDGCPHSRWRLEEARKRATPTKASGSGDRAAL